MRCLLLLCVVLLAAACGQDAQPGTGQVAGAPFAGLPSPGELARRAPEKEPSGVHAPYNRTLVSDGAEYIPWPGWSANAEVSGESALIHGTPGALNYVIYQVSTPLLDHEETITQVMLDFSWPVAVPPPPDGLFIGLPDHDRDRWVWISAQDANGTLLDLSSHDLQGLDPGLGPTGSFIALVNFSGQDVNINSIALRYRTPATTEGDEWLYYMRAGDPLPIFTGVARVQPGSSPETLFEGSLGDIYGFPSVINFSGDWKLRFSRQEGGAPIQIWQAEPDGSSAVSVVSSPIDNYIQAGHKAGTDRGLYVTFSTAPRMLYGYGSMDEGRISRDFDNIESAVWNLANEFNEFAAIAALEYNDGVTSRYGLVSFQGNPPFPINDTPMALYTPLPTEDAHDPEMVELAHLSGEPLYYVYFAARNRDDASFNIYRLRYAGGEPEPVVVDAATDERYPAVSIDGRWLAYQRMPAGSTLGDVGEIYVVDLLQPTLNPQVVASNSLAKLSWYDPTP